MWLQAPLKSRLLDKTVRARPLAALNVSSCLFSSLYIILAQPNANVRVASRQYSRACGPCSSTALWKWIHYFQLIVLCSVRRRWYITTASTCWTTLCARSTWRWSGAGFGLIVLFHFFPKEIETDTVQFSAHAGHWQSPPTATPLPGFNWQGGLWEQSSLVEHHHVHDGPPASDSPPCDAQTHHANQWHRPQHHHGEHIFHRGTVTYCPFLLNSALCFLESPAKQF